MLSVAAAACWACGMMTHVDIGHAMQVERAKKCLDFSFTAYFIHFVACTLYAGVPKQWQWYASCHSLCLCGCAMSAKLYALVPGS